MRMAMTWDFSPPREGDIEKGSERRSIFVGELCGKLLVSGVLGMPDGGRRQEAGGERGCPRQPGGWAWDARQPGRSGARPAQRLACLER